MRAGLLILVIGMFAYPAAASAAVVPIEVVPVSPANGGVYATSNDTMATVAARWTPASTHPRELYVEITNQNILGQDGTLANDFQYLAGSATLYRGDADPSSWTGSTPALFLRQPGTYFFQFQAVGTSQECGTTNAGCTLASPVFSFRTEALRPSPAAQPAPAPPSEAFVWKVADARVAVRRVIKHMTRRTPSGLSRSCSRTSKVRVRCRASWYDTRWVWGGSFRLTIDASTLDIVYSFKGVRASRKCLKTGSVKRCGRNVSF